MSDLVKQFVRGKRIDALATKVMLNDPEKHVEQLIREHIAELERQCDELVLLLKTSVAEFDDGIKYPLEIVNDLKKVFAKAEEGDE